MMHVHRTTEATKTTKTSVEKARRPCSSLTDIQRPILYSEEPMKRVIPLCFWSFSVVNFDYSAYNPFTFL